MKKLIEVKSKTYLTKLGDHIFAQVKGKDGMFLCALKQDGVVERMELTKIYPIFGYYNTEDNTIDFCSWRTENSFDLSVVYEFNSFIENLKIVGVLRKEDMRVIAPEDPKPSVVPLFDAEGKEGN